MTYQRVANLSDLSEDAPFATEASGEPVVLFMLEGDVFATHNVCTHQYALLSDGWLEDGCIECPLHQAQFDIRTGKAMCAPASVDLKTYPVRIEGGEVFIEMGV